VYLKKGGTVSNWIYALFLDTATFNREKSRALAERRPVFHESKSVDIGRGYRISISEGRRKTSTRRRLPAGV